MSDSCRKPGAHGCGTCEDCLTWGDDEYDRHRDDVIDELRSRIEANAGPPELADPDEWRAA